MFNFICRVIVLFQIFDKKCLLDTGGFRKFQLKYEMNVFDLAKVCEYSEKADKLYEPSEPIKGGFVRVVEVMGTDTSVVQAARISYGLGTKTPAEDRKLIRFLMRHRHTSPFEMCEIKLHIRLPIYVMRQWIRHRTANVNEFSGRYSDMFDDIKDSFYFPSLDNMGRQSNSNKQGTDGRYSDAEYNAILEKMVEVCDKAYDVYKDLLDNHNLAKEIARIILPLNVFTEAYWKIDAHNLMHFLKVRMHPGAQYEIRRYAESINDLFKIWMPITAEAFNDYILQGRSYSRFEHEIVSSLIDKGGVKDALVDMGEQLTVREANEFMRDLKILK